MSQTSENVKPLAASFRDPDGFVFSHNGRILRRVNPHYVETFEAFSASELYETLTRKGYLVPHERVESMEDYVIQPEQVPYISYPYEWSFSQLKHAAVLTLAIQKIALEHNMSLKDASSYNVQFFGSQAKFIDTLSFEPLDPTKPWAAYKQFCEHFLGPLALMAHVDAGLNKLILAHLEGIPLQVASRTLPWKTRLNYSLMVHLHLHARSQSKHSNDGADGASAVRQIKMSKEMLLALIESLLKAVNKCKLPMEKTEWGDYYNATNYSDSAMSDKETIVYDWITKHALADELVHDLGANTGRFSSLAAKAGHYVVAHDVDRLAVDRHFIQRRASEFPDRVLPLQLDIANPTPSIGWDLSERDSFLTRCDSGFVLALALVHHLAIGNNTPLDKICAFFAKISRKLVIEFVPKEDSQVEVLLATRADIFPNYTIEGFELAFSEYFKMVEKKTVGDSVRTLYLFERI
jgi:SAM-dependent methyltransferase